MTYPRYKNKIGKPAIWNPKKIQDNQFPKKWIIIYYRELEKCLMTNYKAESLTLNNPMFNAYKLNNIGIVKINGVGSPHATTVLETLIGNGGKIFLNIGSAGGLTKLGNFLCIKSLRDEGTSYHYLSDSEFSFPDEKLTNDFAEELEKNNFIFEKTANWTTDAQFRETKEEINLNIKKKIKTIDMETSALFAVAKYRKVKIASAFVVRDTLIKTRKDFLEKPDFFKNLFSLFDLGIKFFEKEK
jgi:uridine phosphorylase